MFSVRPGALVMQFRRPAGLLIVIFLSPLGWIDGFLCQLDHGRAVAQEAHAHNDYLHPRPLRDALDQSFASVEADIYLVDGQLLVAHDRWQLTPERTLAGLYLDPLRDRIKENGGSVHGDSRPFTLLIDIKSDGETTYRALHQLLEKYSDILSKTTEGGAQPGPVTAIVSGNRAVDVIAGDVPRYVGIDGRFSDLESPLSVDLMPLISDNWNKHFRWRGDGEMPETERRKLADLVSKVHAKGRRIRLWAIPDKPALWEAMRVSGVDLINTDDLAGLAKFLKTARSGR